MVLLPLFQIPTDHLNHIVDVRQDFIIPEAQHMKSTLSQKRTPS